MLKYIGDFGKNLNEYEFIKVNDYEIAYIKRMKNHNVFIDLVRGCVSFHKEDFDELIKAGLVIKKEE